MSPFATLPHMLLLAGRIVPQEAEGYWAPPLDIDETATDLVIEPEPPATSASDVRINLDAQGLLVEGIKGETVRQGGTAIRRFLCVERDPGPFRRLIRLPATVDRTRGTAHFRDGVLTITLPKLRPTEI